MELLIKQFKFTELVAKLITYAYSQGFSLTLGEAYRTPEQAALNLKNGSGISNSLHVSRLAIDISLFINGIYQADSIAYKPLGDYWKSLDPECSWGGDFHKPDGNHFSLTYHGVR